MNNHKSDPSCSQSEDQFIKGVEQLVDPMEVGSIHFLHRLNSLMPKRLQEYLSKSSSNKYPYMGFVVEPYSYFLAYEIIDLAEAQSLLPTGFKLIKTKVFAADEPKYYAILGCFRAHTSAFWGSRIEFYIIAENEETGLLSWVIIGYDTNSISQDKLHGLRSPTASRAALTINHRGKLMVDVRNDQIDRQIVFASDITQGQMQPLDQRLWLEGNLSVTYGKDLLGSTKDVFALTFEPCEVERALQIPLSAIKIDANTWFPDLIADRPDKLVCFPYAQHFISDSPGHTTRIMNRGELEEQVRTINPQQLRPFSVKELRNLILLLTAFSILEFVFILILIWTLIQ